jgi:molybdopterin molybdotransferase
MPVLRHTPSDQKHKQLMAMLSFNEAKSKLLSSARPVTETEFIDLADAYGRVLAEGIISPMTLPPFSNAAMDGYAFRWNDFAGIGTKLQVSQRIAAGEVAKPLTLGSAARIFTGAQVPDGADTVVMQEDCQADGDFVVVNQIPVAGQHVRLKGSDLTAGKLLLAAGSFFSAAAMGLLASVGISKVKVFRRLKVAIFFTGSELVMPGEPLPSGHIYNSNRYVMRGFFQELGVEVIDLGIVRDDSQATRDALRQAAAVADLIVTSGGMSEGDEDHVTTAVKAEGHIDIWKIAAKPGKPFAFGSVKTARGETAFIGLPGNPVSVWSGLLTLVSPFLRRYQGLINIESVPITLRADFSYTVKGNRMEFVRVRHNGHGGLDIYPTQDSAIISSAVWADGIAMIPAGTEVKPGDLLQFLPGPRWNP